MSEHSRTTQSQAKQKQPVQRRRTPSPLDTEISVTVQPATTIEESPTWSTRPPLPPRSPRRTITPSRQMSEASTSAMVQPIGPGSLDSHHSDVLPNPVVHLGRATNGSSSQKAKFRTKEFE